MLEVPTVVYHEHDGGPGESQELRTSYEISLPLGRPSEITEG